MRNYHRRFLRGFPYSMLLVNIGCVVLAVFLSSCSTNLPIQRHAQQEGDGVIVTQYSIVCFIHGDGNYIYHDTSGNEYNADEEALAEAKNVALQNPHTEVFIFHQRPKRNFLLFFPIHDGEFYYYRNGRLVANELYWRDQELANFATEVELYRRFCLDNGRKIASIFLYCGHEIPEFEVAGYNASSPDKMFTVHDLANGLKEFTRDSARFDLMILSTCYGGTPYTIRALGSFARYIVASPDNLHLSYFDLHSLERLDLSLRKKGVSALAKMFAYQAFERLRNDMQTAVSVVVYDVDRVQEYLHSVYKNYDRMFPNKKCETQEFITAIEHCDCAELHMYVLPTMNDGVEVFYRAARFGRLKNKQNHSGWECWRERGSQVSPSQTAKPILD